MTENKKRPDAVLSDLHLSDGAVDVLRNGKFNHRLLCELIVHENFQRFMTDLEIYVDGYVSANIQNLNAGLEATRQMLKKKYAADENDLYMSTLKLGQIDEDEYFGRVLYDELVAILKNIKTEHRKDKTTSDGSMIDNRMKELEDAQKHEGSADEKKIRTALKAIGINYDKLTEDERKLIKKILYKTAMLKPGQAQTLIICLVAYRRNAAAAGRENVHHWFLCKPVLGGQRLSTATPIHASFCRRTGACRSLSQPLFRISRNQGVKH